MKTLKKCFSLTGSRKSGLSFATLVICGIILLAVPLQISCSDSGDDSGDSTVGSTLEGGRMLTRTIMVRSNQVMARMIQIPAKQKRTLSRLPWQRALRIKMLTG